MNKALSWFVKITGFPLEFFYFHKKVYYEDKKHTSNKIKGGALIVSNHTSVYDYPLIMYTFLRRNIYTLVAEVIYQKNSFMKHFITSMGGIRVDRDAHNFAFISKMVDVLNNGKVGLVFPESRLPLENERDSFLEFKPSYVYLALQCEVPIIPVYTNGMYGKLRRKNKERARIVVGKSIHLNDLYDANKSETENIEFINDYIKNKILGLKGYLEEQQGKK